MKTLLSFTVPPNRWFTDSPSNSVLRELKKTGIIVSGKKAWVKWGSAIDELPNPTDRDRVRELLSAMNMIVDFRGIKVDFSIPEGPELNTVSDLLDSEHYEELLERRSASPYIDGEESDQAFGRLFGFMLPFAKEWQLIDQFLLEQLLNRRAVFELFVRNLHLLPARTEVFSRLPVSKDGKESPLLNTRLKKNLDELKSFFERENRELEIVAYSPRSGPRKEKFPHPRLQMIRFDRGGLVTSLDNGFHSLAEKAPVVFAEVGNHEWTSARSALAAMNKEQVV